MDSFKKEHFEQRYRTPFPYVRPLALDELNRVTQLIKSRLRLPDSTSSATLVKEIDKIQRPVPSVNADEKSFDLLQVIPERRRRSDVVYVDWYRFDDIDEVETSTLASFFSDFWYPSADDIDIFDRDLTWILSVRHDGAIKLVELSME